MATLNHELEKLKEFEKNAKAYPSFHKNRKTDKVYWLNNSYQEGEHVFSFDKKTTFNLFADYPRKLTPEQKKIFDKENPFWAEFFRSRT